MSKEVKAENVEIKLRPREKMLKRLLSIIQLYQAVHEAKNYVKEGSVVDGYDEIQWDKDEINIKLVTVEEPENKKIPSD